MRRGTGTYLAAAGAMLVASCSQHGIVNLAAPASTTSTTWLAFPSTTTTTVTPERLSPVRASRSAARRRVAAASTADPKAGGTPSDIWACIRRLESGGNYRENTGNGYYGAYQFSASMWRSMGTGYARADLAPPAVQDDAARRLQARSGWGQWSTAKRCGV